MLFPLPSSIVSHIRNDDGTMTGTGTEYASFIFTIALQHICPTFSASKIIIEYSSYFARVQPSEPVSPHNTAIPLKRYICSDNIWNVCKKVCQCAVSPRVAAGDWHETSSEEKMASARPHETPRHGQPGEASDLQYTKSDINNILIHCPRHSYHYLIVHMK